MTEAVEGAENSGEENEAEETEEVEPVVVKEPFDEERAMKTIANQRKSEDKLKAQLAVYKAAEDKAAEKEKSKDQIIADRDARILELEMGVALTAATTDFKAQAQEAGIADPDLALLVAKDSGILGDYDPKKGQYEVGKVDFEKLLDDHPVLAGEGSKRGLGASGGAGRISDGKKPRTDANLFNRAIRGG